MTLEKYALGTCTCRLHPRFPYLTGELTSISNRRISDHLLNDNTVPGVSRGLIRSPSYMYLTLPVKVYFRQWSSTDITHNAPGVRPSLFYNKIISTPGTLPLQSVLASMRANVFRNAVPYRVETRNASSERTSVCVADDLAYMTCTSLAHVKHELKSIG